MTDTLAGYWKRYKALSPWFVMACYVATLVVWGVLFLSPQSDRLLIAAVVIPLGVIADHLLHRSHAGRPNFESSLITSGIVALLLPPGISLLQAAAAVLLAVGSKHIIRFKGKHLFNPAAFGVAVTAIVFGYALGWWPDSYVWIAVALGLLNVWRVKKFPQVLSFAAVYIVLLLVLSSLPLGSFSFDGLGQQTLPLALPWFFMLFMLPEPVTSRQPRDEQLVFGALAAAVGVAATYVGVLADAAMLWGLLAANAFARLR